MFDNEKWKILMLELGKGDPRLVEHVDFVGNMSRGSEGADEEVGRDC